MKGTDKEYKKIISKCRKLFEEKMSDYGPSWRILRLTSLTDQIFIKAQRVRNIQVLPERKVDEGQEQEFMGIVNYSLIALMQIKLGLTEKPDLSAKSALDFYDKEVSGIYELMKNKNHDYGEAWRDMRISSLTDLILQKLLRIKQIEGNQGMTIISEGIDANYQDMANYAIFARIHFKNQSNPSFSANPDFSGFFFFVRCSKFNFFYVLCSSW